MTRRRTPESVRFDIAHELGNLVMHSRGTDFATGKEGEREADRFAAKFLMPSASVNNYMPQDPTQEKVFELKRFYGISAMAMAVKAKTSRKLTEWSYRTMREKLVRAGYDKDEPNGRTAYEKTRVFEFLFDTQRTTRWTPAKLAQELCLPVDDLQSLTLRTVIGIVITTGHTVAGAVTGREVASPRLHAVKIELSGDTRRRSKSA